MSLKIAPHHLLPGILRFLSALIIPPLTGWAGATLKRKYIGISRPPMDLTRPFWLSACVGLGFVLMRWAGAH